MLRWRVASADVAKLQEIGRGLGAVGGGAGADGADGVAGRAPAAARALALAQRDKVSLVPRNQAAPFPGRHARGEGGFRDTVLCDIL